MNLSDYINCLRRRVEEMEKEYPKSVEGSSEHISIINTLDTVIEDLEFIDKKTFWDVDGVTFINAELKKSSV